ncbi:MAG: RluA family pseudouridine synthase [Thermoguttaceae bacterium]|nr:RluA family pseudouridine synthase [Thermoguttaceae bacterium]MDW8038114.1 RluA family pseudouridine synthase [Thermoguttaceae bacterium]
MTEAQKQNYHVPMECAGWTLAALLRRVRPELSWSQAKRLIHHRHVQVNGNLCMDDARRLKPGDVVAVWQEPLARPIREEDIQIVYQDPYLVVVDKPAGITTLRHPEERHWPRRRRQLQPTLDEMVLEILQGALSVTNPTGRSSHRKTPTARKSQKSNSGSQKHRPSHRLRRLYPVHRLDRDTSGLIVFALRPEAYLKLVQMFRKHQIHRVYLALALGRVEEQTFRSYLVRDRGDGLRGSTQEPGKGQLAVTHVRPLEYLPGYTLLECRLETGRTHQIRIHLSEAGHRVCGEKIYTHPLGGKPIPDPSGAMRHMLHAAQLGFQHPITGEPLLFESPMPTDMRRLIEKLRHQPESPPPN